MFGWLSRRPKKNKERKIKKPPVEREISLTPVINPLVGRPVPVKPRRLDGKEFRIVKKGLDPDQVLPYIEELLAENKALRGEEALAAIKSRAEAIEAEAKQKALVFLLRAREEIGKEITERYKEAYDRLFSALHTLKDEGQRVEAELKENKAPWEKEGFELKGYDTALLDILGKAVLPAEGAAPIIVEGQAATTEVAKPTAEEPRGPLVAGAGVTKGEPGQQQVDEQSLFSGEVELTIHAPVKLNLLSKLYTHLQAIPDIKLLWTTSSRNQDTTITLVAEKWVPLLGLMSQIPDIKVTAEVLDKDGVAKKGVPGSSLQTGRQTITRIKLALAEK